MPVNPALAPTPSALAGTMASSGTAAPFAPSRGVPVVLTLRGTWQGSARLCRSTDGGATLNPLTVAGAPWGLFFANACEAVWEENDPAASLYLVVTLVSGSLDYRVGH